MLQQPYAYPSLISGDIRLRVGRKKGKGTSDLIKALAGRAHWREPADATWSRLSSRAGLPTATTEDTVTQGSVRLSRARLQQAFSAPSETGSCVCAGALRGESPAEAEETRASGLGFRCPCLRVRTGAALGPCPPHPILGLFLDVGGKVGSFLRGELAERARIHIASWFR